MADKITRQGHENLLQTIAILRRGPHAQAVAEMAAAVEAGNVEESDDYRHAYQNITQLERRIVDLEQLATTLEIVDIADLPSDEIVFGTRFSLRDEKTGNLVTYQLVGPPEIDSTAGKVSYLSPLGEAVLGAQPGDLITFETPRGSREMIVEAIIKQA